MKNKKLRYPTQQKLNKPRSLNEALANGWKVKEHSGVFDENMLASGYDIIKNPDGKQLEVPFVTVTVYGRPRPITKTAAG